MSATTRTFRPCHWKTDPGSFYLLFAAGQPTDCWFIVELGRSRLEILSAL